MDEGAGTCFPGNPVGPSQAYDKDYGAKAAYPVRTEPQIVIDLRRRRTALENQISRQQQKLAVCRELLTLWED